MVIYIYHTQNELLLYHSINHLLLMSYKTYMIWTADKNSKGMLCSPHHEIFKDTSYHFKFNPNIQFRIPEFKTTSIVSPGHMAISKLSIIIHYSKMYSTIYMLL